MQRQTRPTNVPYLPSSSRFPSSRAASPNPNGFNYDPESESQIREREDHDDLNQVIMAIDVNSNGTVGCAYYVAREEKLHLLQDIEAGGDTVIDSRQLGCRPVQRPEAVADSILVKADIEPTVVLVSNRVNLERDRDAENQNSADDSDGERLFKSSSQIG